MILLIVLSMLTLVYAYPGWRLLGPLQVGFPWKLVLGLPLLLLALLPFLLFRLRRAASMGRLHDLLAWIGYTSLGFFALLASLLLVRDLIWLLLAGLSSWAPGREWLNALNAGTASLALILAGWGFFQARRTPPVRQVRLSIPGLPADLEGFRIAQISDIHAGPTIKGSFVRRLAARLRALEPDLIAFTGDLADGTVERLRPHVESLSALPAPCGRFFVTGNHEYYAGVDAWIGEVRRLGFEVLLNEHRLVHKGQGRLLVAGITDYGAGELVPAHASDPQAALEGAPFAHVRLLLAHQPRSVEQAAAHGVHLQLSGHTHGGQFLPWKWFIPLQQPYLAGLYRIGQTWLYVHSGCGYWGPPLRLGSASEIALITLAGETDNRS